MLLLLASLKNVEEGGEAEGSGEGERAEGKLAKHQIVNCV